jgi:uncharacterized protein YndB with AHSA1/START domain
MTDATSTDQSTLRLEREFHAPPDAVFDAWTNPEVLRRWWAAGPDWDTPLAEVDLRVGGRYRLTMRNPSAGDEHTIAGEYLDVRRPDRLVYTWAWEPAGQRSEVTVDFVADGDRTRVVITHAGLDTDESRAQHEHGWNACLDNLRERVLSGS